MKISGLQCGLVAMLVVGVSACAEEIESDTESGPIQAASLTLASPATPSARDGARFSTYLYSERDVDVYSRLGGSGFFEQGVIIQAIQVEVGDRVQAGQVLATLEDDEAAIELEAAQARAEEARLQYRRMEELRNKEFVSPQEYDAARSAMRTTDAELKRAELNMSRTRVRAPFAGVVAKRYVRERELVEEGTPLFRVTAMTPLRARLLVPEARAAAFGVGAPIKITGAHGDEGDARVLVVGPTIDPGSGTREVIIQLSDPDGFRPGSGVVIEPQALPEGGAR